MKANLYNSKELQAVLAQYPSTQIPQYIPAYNAGAYNFVGLRVKQGAGISTELQVQVFTKDVNTWEAMTEAQKNPAVMGAFQQVIMIHNPFLVVEQPQPEEEEEEDSKPQTRLTKAKKAQIDKLMEAGEGKDDDGLALIAEKVGLTFEQVKDYIQSF